MKSYYSKINFRIGPKQKCRDIFKYELLKTIRVLMLVFQVFQVDFYNLSPNVLSSYDDWVYCFIGADLIYYSYFF